ncbi:peptide chain release factor N(5)-glutamine methyltransferase [Demequina capsici]|uniref:Peptide chain release factor N(5)-glutamine methyltransferase n=1 Tax=Demequina capsici TaxID=3075620 RepID=A0AA96JCN2_9MICO|nr:peptide chain release factor N(5)-glutamine methyltransferase [Demequina sp. OYTSA14]WNM23804.1 peptide chain release factor N(5)-glutamine methyltransferase [Demequina sp. OYTSA14]
MPSVGARLRDISRRLADAGVPSPDHDAVALMAYTFGWTTAEVRTAAARDDHWPEDPLDHDLLEARVTRRANREPLQHITGSAPFRHLDLQVGVGVFIPRPETEMVAQVALDLARDAAPSSDGLVHVTDLCAGSGAIGLSIATEMENAHVSLVEASEEANVYLRLNSQMLPPSVRRRVRPMLADARGCLHLFERCAQIVVTNPPYIPPNAVPRDQEVRDYDPPQALYGLGEDGLEVPRAIIDEAARLLEIGGWLVMEHGELQGAQLRAYAESSEFWDDVHTRQDLTGRDRMLVARRVGV